MKKLFAIIITKRVSQTGLFCAQIDTTLEVFADLGLGPDTTKVSGDSSEFIYGGGFELNDTMTSFLIF